MKVESAIEAVRNSGFTPTAIVYYINLAVSPCTYLSVLTDPRFGGVFRVLMNEARRSDPRCASMVGIYQESVNSEGDALVLTPINSNETFLAVYSSFVSNLLNSDSGRGAEFVVLAIAEDISGSESLRDQAE